MPLQKISTSGAFAPLPAKACTSVTIRNKCGNDVDVRMAIDPASDSINTLADGDVITLDVQGLASEIEIKSDGVHAGINLVYQS